MLCSPIRANIAFDSPGIHHGDLILPYSSNESAWGSIMIPICVFNGNDGPTALLTGANHGDEYEGAIALAKLSQCIHKEKINGRVIVVPYMNYPAFLAGARCSPIDAGNLNRSFPGRPDGTCTEKIADYFQRCLLPMSDYVLDIHSGGSTLEFVPYVAIHELDDEVQQQKCAAAMRDLGAPYSLVAREPDSVGTYDTAAESLGKVFVTTELGGGGTATPQSVAIAERVARNFLIHAGILDQDIDVSCNSFSLRIPESGGFLIAESDGLVEFRISLGAAVEEGQPIASLHDTRRTGVPPRVVEAPTPGILIGRHFKGLAKRGDCLAVIAREAH